MYKFATVAERNLCLQEEKESKSWQKGFYLFVVYCFHFSGSHMNQWKSFERQNKSQQRYSEQKQVK